MGFQDQLSLNADQSIAECSKGEHSAVLSTFIMLLKTGFTVYSSLVYFPAFSIACLHLLKLIHLLYGKQYGY